MNVAKNQKTTTKKNSGIFHLKQIIIHFQDSGEVTKEINNSKSYIK